MIRPTWSCLLWPIRYQRPLANFVLLQAGQTEQTASADSASTGHYTAQQEQEDAFWDKGSKQPAAEETHCITLQLCGKPPVCLIPTLLDVWSFAGCHSPPQFSCDSRVMTQQSCTPCKFVQQAAMCGIIYLAIAAGSMLCEGLSARLTCAAAATCLKA